MHIWRYAAGSDGSSWRLTRAADVWCSVVRWPTPPHTPGQKQAAGLADGADGRREHRFRAEPQGSPEAPYCSSQGLGSQSLPSQTPFLVVLGRVQLMRHGHRATFPQRVADQQLPSASRQSAQLSCALPGCVWTSALVGKLV